MPPPLNSPIPVVINKDQFKVYANHRHLQYGVIQGRSLCAARCICGHICSWHKTNSSREFVAGCAWVERGKQCECPLFRDQGNTVSECEGQQLRQETS